MNAAMNEILKLPLFTGFGVEMEYMIVDRDTLNVLPIVDKALHKISGAYEGEVDRGKISWSNELALHVIEFKTSGPEKSLRGIDTLFQEQIREANALLEEFNAMLMPTAMHPWMDPYKEMKLWPHSQNPIYESFNRIFDCRGHGWSNLQSMHLNLPFANDAEFAKLHAAIRVLLPVMAGLAASSPIMENQATGLLDTRLEVYRHNSKAIPSITGKVIPEVTLSEKDYEKRILMPMYRDIAPQDPENVLRQEWLNSRGAIARFDRFTIEIRTLDVQECPSADLAIVHLIVAVLKSLTEETWQPITALNNLDTDVLYHLFLDVIRDGEQSVITNQDYLRVFGIDRSSCTVGALWQSLYQELLQDSLQSPEIHQAMQCILTKGPLSRRILKALEAKQDLHGIYRKLCECLQQGKLFQ